MRAYPLLLIAATSVFVAASFHGQKKQEIKLARAFHKGAATFYWTLCGKSMVQNFGGLGPATGAAPELRYLSVGAWKGKDVDLVLANTSSFDSKNVTKNGKVGGAAGCVGRLNVKPSTTPGTLAFSASFVYADGTGPVDTSNLAFQFTLLDLDIGIKSGVQEKVTLGVEPTSTDVSEGIEDLGGGVFQAILTGNGSNNPATLADVSKDVEVGKRSLGFVFSKQSSIPFTFDAVKTSGDMVGAGRNFMFVGPDATPAPTPSPTSAPEGEDTCATCVIWGDPHVITFDLQQKRLRQHPQREAFFRTRGWRSDEKTVVEAGTFWLVRHDKVQIQGKYEHMLGNEAVTSLTEIAVGGPFLEGNVLVLQPLNGKTTYNGQEILPAGEMPSSFSTDFVSAFYHKAAELVKDGTHGPGVDISLPMGVKLTVNRWKTSMAVAIKLKGPLPGGQGGQCGDFDGNAAGEVGTDERAVASEFLARKVMTEQI